MKLTPAERAQYLQEAMFDFPKMMRRLEVLKAEEFVNNVEKLRRESRARIHVRRVHHVDHVGGDQEKLTCTACGRSEIQRVGGCDFPIDPALAKKLINYRGKRSDGTPSGIMAECPGCTKKARDERYPKGWSPWNNKKATS